MKLPILSLATLVLSMCLTTPVNAEVSVNNQTAQTQPNAEQVLNACLQNRADTLPIPFTDLSPNDWAFKAVMNLYYCGAIGPNTPPEVIEKLRNSQQQ